MKRRLSIIFTLVFSFILSAISTLAQETVEIDPAAAGAFAGVAVGLLVFMLFFVFLFLVALYVYTAWAWMTIARKLKHPYPWLAWIPVANLFLYPMLAKKSAWWGLILFVPIVNIVFFIMWTWSIYEQRNYPPWLSLVVIGALLPAVGTAFTIAVLVIWGLVAWHDLPAKRRPAVVSVPPKKKKRKVTKKAVKKASKKKRK